MMSKINIEKAREKYWVVNDGVVAKYKFDRCTYDSLLPEFNSEFKYYYIDESTIYKNVTRSIYAADNDFINITNCISTCLGNYAEDENSKLPHPMYLEDGIYFTRSDWDSLNIDLCDYKGKEITITFDITFHPSDAKWSEMDIGIERPDHSDFDSIDKIMRYEENHTTEINSSFNVTWTIPNEDCQIYLGGMYITLDNINIMVDDYNLFPGNIKSDYDYVISKGIIVNKPAYYDDKLVFTHYWNDMLIRCDQFIGKKVTVSFDVEPINAPCGYSSYEVRESRDFTFYSGDEWTERHYEKTFTIDMNELYIGGGGVKITNLRILVDNRTEGANYDELPTFMCFGDNVEEVGNDATNSLLELIYADTSNLTSMKNMFCCCENMYLCNTSNWDTSKVTDMYSVFAACYSMKLINVSSFDTSKVTDMYGMFANCLTLEYLDVSNFDTSNVTDMGNMFVNCYELERLNLNNFNVGKVTRMRVMFINCKKLKTLSLSGWRITSVASPNLYRMFYNCNKLEDLDLSYWNITNGYNLDGLLGENNTLKHIKMIGCDEHTVNKIIESLPTTNTVDGAKIYTSLSTNLSFINNTPSNWEVVRGNDVKSHIYLSKQVQEILLKNRNLKQIHVGDTKTMYHK